MNTTIKAGGKVSVYKPFSAMSADERARYRTQSWIAYVRMNVLGNPLLNFKL